jgi:hypothetical protein
MQSISKRMIYGEFPQDIRQSLCETTTIQTEIGVAECHYLVWSLKQTMIQSHPRLSFTHTVSLAVWQVKWTTN